VEHDDVMHFDDWLQELLDFSPHQVCSLKDISSSGVSLYRLDSLCRILDASLLRIDSFKSISAMLCSCRRPLGQ
jgi:hypothetical protein